MSNTTVIPVDNVNDALVEGIWFMRAKGIPYQSRNGPVLRAPGPVITEYRSPKKRVLFNPVRDANPVFHLMESIWMLAGERNVEWLLPFNSGFANYAEPDTLIQHGAYGWRWRFHFQTDQITKAIALLRANPADRRVVIGMWDPARDLGTGYKDVPCNTTLYVDIVDGALNLTILCRSNDMIWGAYGANAVHMSILQEVIAHGVGVPVGMMYQISSNFHVYTENEIVKKLWADPPHLRYNFYDEGLYTTGITGALPILVGGETVENLLADCERFVVYDNDGDFRTAFLGEVAWPLKRAYLARKEKDPDWRLHLADVPDCDWKLAFQQWTDRREQAREALNDKEGV